MNTLTLDFETLPITKTERWPRPVGFAYKLGGGHSSYCAFGHPTGNNTTASNARARLVSLIKDAKRILFFNASFDVGVAHWLGVRIPWPKVEDAQILAFLADPYAQPRDLKTFAHVHLGMEPAEQNDLHTWIKANVKGTRARKRLGEFYHLAPGDLVGRYASGDVDRTYHLAREFERQLKGQPQWGEAYRRELDLLPILEGMSIEGVPLDAEALRGDHESFLRVLGRADTYLCRLLGAEVDLNRRGAVADALEKADLVKEWVLTPDDGRSLAYEALAKLAAEDKFDRTFAEAWGYRSLLMWMLRTFMGPWAAAGLSFHPGWNSVKTDGFGAVTGRLSSTPNVQNVTNTPPTFRVPRGWPALPKLRKYIRAPKGFLLAGIDISQQELRVLAHAAGDPLRQWYRDNSKLDLHQKVVDTILAVTGLTVSRSAAKALNLAGIYGQGVAALAGKLGIEVEAARALRRAHQAAVPGVQKWMRGLAAKPTLTTVGGRTYLHDPERPYKSGNTYIQGSSADQLKCVMIAVDEPLRALGAQLVLTAHDELLALAPVGQEQAALKIMSEAIEATGWPHEGAPFSVPMLADSYVGETWE